MSIKFIGNTVIDNRGDITLDLDGNLLFFDQLANEGDILDIISCMDAESSELAPHKIVRVLIDDEVGND